MSGPYAKNKNYIAVVCCYEDRGPAGEMATELTEQGYCIRQEEWLNQETEWTKNAGQGLKGCRAGMVFLSNTAVANHGFRQRLNYLMKEKKPFFVVTLEEVTNLSLGMQLQLAGAKNREELLQECREKAEDTGNEKPWGYLLYVKNNEKTELIREEFFLGRSEEVCDYVIRTNSMIGRRHAKIAKVKGTYRLTDTNSLNGTYLNGHRIMQEKEYMLQTGDHILFANEEFIFYSNEE